MLSSKYNTTTFKKYSAAFRDSTAPEKDSFKIVGFFSIKMPFSSNTPFIGGDIIDVLGEEVIGWDNEQHKTSFVRVTEKAGEY